MSRGRIRYGYEEALARCGQPEVRKAIRRFIRLPLKTRAGIPLLWWLLDPCGTPPLKMSKIDAAYQAFPMGQQTCFNCRSAYLHVTSSTYICDQMRGTIEVSAWCRLWKPPFQSPEYYRAYQER